MTARFLEFAGQTEYNERDITSIINESGAAGSRHWLPHEVLCSCIEMPFQINTQNKLKINTINYILIP